MSTRPDQGKVEDEVLDHLAEARERIKDMNPEEGLKHRLDAIEETFGALASTLRWHSPRYEARDAATIERRVGA
jgi:hypothetical protein